MPGFVAPALDSALDAVYVHVPAAVTADGAVLLRPGKEARLVEVDAIERDLAAAGVEVLARLDPPATAEGGDVLWLDETRSSSGAVTGRTTPASTRSRRVPGRSGGRRRPAALAQAAARSCPCSR